MLAKSFKKNINYFNIWNNAGTQQYSFYQIILHTNLVVKNSRVIQNNTHEFH
jgi:hypothetical protein